MQTETVLSVEEEQTFCIHNSSFIIPILPSQLPGSMYQLHNNIRQSILKTVDFFYPPFRRFIPLQTFRYAACGGANMLFDITLFTLSFHFLYKKNNIDLGFYVMSAPTASLLTASFISFFPGFYLSRYVVFPESEVRGRTQLIRYLVIVVICLLLNYYLFWFFINFLGLYPTLSKIMTTVFVVLFSYLSQTYFSFRIKRKTGLSLPEKKKTAYK